ncbi:hypothetical protein OHA25_61090 (plasmid) [Nonomuraea sp. NBC_00507]|uniref:hypothetical protein n=1 Tax=Nonomuraea sp. NBC_00507 TaxID=2976002 RepID=UPI002E17CEC3
MPDPTPLPLTVPLLVTVKTAAPLPRAAAQDLIERLAAAAARVDATDPSVMPVFHLFDDQPGHYPLVLFIDATDIAHGHTETMDDLVHRALARVEAEAGDLPIEVGTLSQEEALAAGNTADRIYSPAGAWSDHRAEADDLKRLVDGPPLPCPRDCGHGLDAHSADLGCWLCDCTYGR